MSSYDTTVQKNNQTSIAIIVSKRVEAYMQYR